jgi:hypothetical protein
MLTVVKRVHRAEAIRTAAPRGLILRRVPSVGFDGFAAGPRGSCRAGGNDRRMRTTAFVRLE